ncbi:Glycosyltransferase Family 4 [Granulicella pectinivorans]|uniref:Glycosyltransferase Family 4 n=1 Tax=Granulicella pectinivorans TaxID=474950 RepID=A0A1I6LKN4_9BACT|nr:glycosyltransferase family 4 protein [Granulicella pectinivorans]SFS04087.1 Glycosyltransferase Family 4 [Granulicella pectinivorans]
MIVTQAVFGVYHHFELAREFERRGHLERIYSTWPWARLKREGLPQPRVESFPWIHTPEMILGQRNLMPRWLGDHLGYANALLFDEWTLRRIPPCDAFIGISGAGLKTGQLVQSRGGKFVCDRGSSHQRYQEEIVADEQRRWNVDRPVSDIRDTIREEKIYAAADAITVPSTFAARSFIEMGVAAEKIHTIPYGVRLENFKKVADPPADRFEVLFVGGVALRKGIPYLLQSFAKLKHPGKRLRIIGSVPDWMRPVIARFPQDHVEILGAVPQSELTAIMSSSHVLVLPSIEEGLALVQGQALACGLPVLASTNTGAEDLFTDSVEGYIVPVRDVDALASRMQQLADDPALQQRMSAAALERVQHLGGWTQYGDRWVDLLQNLTGKQ